MWASGALPLADALARLPRAPVRGPPLSPTTPAPLSAPTGEEKDGFALAHVELAYMPFSHGPMNCPGKGLAMMEIRMLVTAILQQFKVRLLDGWDPAEYEQNFKDYFNATRPDLPVTLESRW